MSKGLQGMEDAGRRAVARTQELREVARAIESMPRWENRLFFLAQEAHELGRLPG